MKKISTYIGFVITILFIASCSSPKFIHNPDSYKRQQELKEMRSGIVMNEIFNISSSVISAAFDSEFDVWIPEKQQLKKLNLINPTNDTIYVNMLSDVYWTDSVYCDFMDIRIPPKANFKILVPLDTNYNLYFSNTPQKTDDELMQLNTENVKEIKLNPETSLLSTSTK